MPGGLFGSARTTLYLRAAARTVATAKKGRSAAADGRTDGRPFCVRGPLRRVYISGEERFSKDIFRLSPGHRQHQDLQYVYVFVSVCAHAQVHNRLLHVIASVLRDFPKLQLFANTVRTYFWASFWGKKEYAFAQNA